jgi:hypothetical protein
MKRIANVLFLGQHKSLSTCFGSLTLLCVFSFNVESSNQFLKFLVDVIKVAFKLDFIDAPPYTKSQATSQGNQPCNELPRLFSCW